MPSEPRFENKHLSTIEVQLAGGIARKSFNSCGKTSNLLNYTNIFSNPNICNFCKIGKFELFEANFNFTTNITDNLFAQLYIPVRSSITFTRILKPCTDNNIFRENMTGFFNNNLLFVSYRKSGLADCAFLLGYTLNYQDTEYLDYIDTTLQLGVLFPTAKRKNVCCPLDFSFGYGGHWGLPIVFDASIGLNDWFTIGFDFNNIFLFSRNNNLDLFNLPDNINNNFKNKVKLGSVTAFAFYIKADHLLRGLSSIIGFNYAFKSHNYIYLNNSKIDLESNDPALNNWSIATFNFLLEYDFACQDSTFGPRVSFIYNLPIAGKRVIKTAIIGSIMTLEICCNF